VAFQKEVHLNLVLSMSQGQEKFHLAPLCNMRLGNVKNGASVVPKKRGRREFTSQLLRRHKQEEDGIRRGAV
jgi:hypothetical protein